MGGPILSAVLVVILAAVVWSGARDRPEVTVPPAASPGPTTTGGAAGPSPTPAPPPRELFVFPSTGVIPVAVDPEGAREPAGVAAEKIRTLLSFLYDRAYVDPAAWSLQIPDDLWDAFAPDVRERAQQDRDSFALSGLPSSVDDLEVTTSRLVVRVLLDPQGRPEAALAEVTFDARVLLALGDAVDLSTQASLVLQPVGGRWLIVAYPEAANRFDPAPAPSPSTTSGPSGPAGSGTATPAGSSAPSPTPGTGG